MEPYHNSILQGQRSCLHEVAGKGTPFPHRQWARKQSRRQKSAVHEQRQEKAVKRTSTVVAVFKCDRFMDHWDRDVCPTCPTLRETSREKPPTSTTITGRTIVETIQRERPAISPTTARDQTPMTAASQPEAARREATSGVPVLRPPEGEPAVLTSGVPRHSPRRRCPRGLPCWRTSWGNWYLRNLIRRSKAGSQRPCLNRHNRLLRPNNLRRYSRRLRMLKESYSSNHINTCRRSTVREGRQ